MNTSLLLFGGSSGERLVSVASAQNIADQFNFDEIMFLASDGCIYQVTQSELLAHTDPFLNEFKAHQKALELSLESGISFFKNKTVFLALHGTEGEDGKIQKLFEFNKVAFTASDSIASQNAFHKDTSKKIVQNAQIKIVDSILFDSNQIRTAKNDLLKFFKTHQKIVLKPAANGSSIGLHILDQTSDFEKAMQEIEENRLGEYLAEKFIQGRELTVGVFEAKDGLKALPPSEVIVNPGRAFDYEGKYLGKGSIEITPAQLTPQEALLAQQMALQAHRALKCYGYSRTDLILTSTEPIYLETNTLPGLSRPSFFPQQLNVADIPFKIFIQRQLELAENR